MSLLQGLNPSGLLALVEERVRLSTHNRVRNLSVAELDGRLVVAGQVTSHHTKQLALQGALELLSGEQFATEITVYSIVPCRDSDARPPARDFP